MLSRAALAGDTGFCQAKMGLRRRSSNRNASIGDICERPVTPTVVTQPYWYAVQTRSRHETKVLRQLEYDGLTISVHAIQRSPAIRVQGYELEKI
jgi:hypothetical protein